MNRLKRAALLTRLIEDLREYGSWCGETHVQKAAFFVQDLMGVPLEFDFVLYKHGPFSFELREELTGLRADEMILLEPQWPYGPRIATTDQSHYIQRIYSKSVTKYESDIEYIACTLGQRDVTELERLATAFYIMRRSDLSATVYGLASEIHKLKPHISMEVAKMALDEVARIRESTNMRN